MIRATAILAFALLPASHGFAIVPSIAKSQAQPVSPKFPASSILRMSDFDFPSAMPEKPQLTLDEKIAQSADEFIQTTSSAFGEGVEEPPELDALRQALKNGANTNEIALRIYELMIERGMMYDEDPETGK
jgi:hypothetical protein